MQIIIRLKHALSKLNIFKGLTSHVSCLTPLVLLAFMAGCASRPAVKTERYFWPPLPDQPRIEFIGAYMNQYDFPRTGGQSFVESLTGKLDPVVLDRPWGIASDGEGRVYVANTNGRQLLLFDFINSKVTPIGAEDLFGAPAGVALDGTGNVYVSDFKKRKVFVFDKNGAPLSVIGDPTVLEYPLGMAVSDKSGRLYVANSRKHVISVFDISTGAHLFDIGKRGEGDGEFNYPTDVAINSIGNIVVSDSVNARVQILDMDGKFVSKFGHRGDGVADFSLIKGLAVDREDRIYVVDGRLDKFLIFDKDGVPLLNVGGPGSVKTGSKQNPGGFFIPQDMAIDKKGRVYVVDSMNARFQVFQVVDEEWLKEHPIKEKEAAVPKRLNEEKEKKK